MQARIATLLEEKAAAILGRLDGSQWTCDYNRPFMAPMLLPPPLHYDMSPRSRGVGYGGVPLVLKVFEAAGLVDAINNRLRVFKLQIGPYRESDHVLNFVINTLCEGRTLQDIELRRRDEGFLDMIGARSLPAPSTAGDFCRRFTCMADIISLESAIHDARLKIWGAQPASFFEAAYIDMDGTFVVTGAECMQGIDINYQGDWSYHPLIISLANTGEVMTIINRSGNRPSHEGAAEAADRQIAVCRKAGFREIVLRGDTDFKQTAHLDRWTDNGVWFYFGYDAFAALKTKAESLDAAMWEPLGSTIVDPKKPRQKPGRHKQAIVDDRNFKDLHMVCEDVAEFRYQPNGCDRAYRMIVLRKKVKVLMGQQKLWDEFHYFFYITNDETSAAAEVVGQCRSRCNQENLHAQLKDSMRAVHSPVNTLLANNAYMLMASLAWTGKAWLALSMPIEEPTRLLNEHQQQRLLRMEFRTFVNYLIKLPVQIVRQSRKVVLRVLSYNSMSEVFFRLAAHLNL